VVIFQLKYRIQKTECRIQGEPLELFTGTAGVLPAPSAVRREKLVTGLNAGRHASRSALAAGGTPAVPVKSLSVSILASAVNAF
jgi:hypothetical protein